MSPWKNHMLTGLLTGLLAPIAAFYLFVFFFHPGESFMEAARFYYKGRVLTHVISLSAIANLAIFFLFLRFQYEHSAKGVIGATFFWVIIVLALKFL